MTHLLLPSTPIYGHVMPMLTLGHGLVARGHTVTVLTGRKYAAAARRAGLDFLALPEDADYDDAALEAAVPGRVARRRLAAGRADILGLFVRPLEAQHRALTAALASQPYDAVLAETAFLGVLPLLATAPPDRRPPVLGVSTTPLATVSLDTAPFGSGLAPGRATPRRRRYRLLNALIHRGPLRPVHRALDRALAPFGVPAGEINYFDVVTRFDVTFHLAPPGIEYPRRELPGSVRCVGPLRCPPGEPVVLPSWWADLDGRRPIVHLTQGTVDNRDLRKLLVPAVRGLADLDAWVVVATGGRPVAELRQQFGGPLPANTRTAEFLPYDRLLDRTDVVVTNGGFGGVQRALAHGVPLVVAGATEDKPEVAARVAWAGAGVNLRTGRPSPGQIAGAVGEVLSDPRYGGAAERLRTEIRALGDPVDTIAETLRRMLAARARTAA